MLTVRKGLLVLLVAVTLQSYAVTTDSLKCKCGCGGQATPVLLSKLNQLESRVGSFHISSGYRCPKHNRNVGGVKNSQHVKGLAADITCSGKRQKEIIAAAKDVGFTGIGVARTFVHIDLGPSRTWRY